MSSCPPCRCSSMLCASAGGCFSAGARLGAGVCWVSDGWCSQEGQVGPDPVLYAPIFPQSYRCDCDPGWSGTNCDINNNECESNPCMNGGTCKDMTSGYICTCREGFSGKGAARDAGLSPPTLGPGWELWVGVPMMLDGLEASLWAWWRPQVWLGDVAVQPAWGPLAEFGHPWLELRAGGSSRAMGGPLRLSPHAHCYPQPPPTSTPPSQPLLSIFLNTGPNCQTNINECASNPCLNQGTCIDDVAGYTCNCLLPYTGEGEHPVPPRPLPELCGAAASGVTANRSLCMCNEPSTKRRGFPCTALPWGSPQPWLHLPVPRRSWRKFGGALGNGQPELPPPSSSSSSS